MANTSQKMRLRSAILATLNKYRNNPTVDNAQIKEDTEALETIEDKEYLCKILLKEISGDDTILANICSLFAIELISNEIFEKQAFTILKDKKISDERKFYVISIMKQKGIEFDYDNVSEYIQNPEEIAQSGVRDFLSNAISDPEVQIDLLDFYLNIPKDERLSLLDNLINEFEGDDLANAFSILTELDVEEDELEYLLNGLLQAKSPYSLEGLNYILNNYNLDKKINKIIEKAIKEIKFANPNFVNNAIISNSKIMKCYISFADGHSEFSLVIARQNPEGLIDTCLFTMHLLKGITACMGFGAITPLNFKAVVKRLFYDSIPVEINPVMLKALGMYYYAKNKKTNTKLPFEFIVWKKLLNDVKDLNNDVSDVINSKLESINLTETQIKKIANSKMLENWLFEYGQNKHVDKIIKKLEKEHMTDINNINDIVKKSITSDFLTDKDFNLELTSRLLIQAYVAHLAKLTRSSSCAYSLCFETPHKNMFINIMIDKSLYCYFADKIADQESQDKNVFDKQDKISSKYTKEELEDLMSKLEAKWN